MTKEAFEKARELCKELAGKPVPEKVYFAKGCARVYTPEGAVARIGSSESETVVFLDSEARPICAYRAVSSGPITWAEKIPTPNPEDIDYRRVYGLGKSIADVLYGVRGD